MADLFDGSPWWDETWCAFDLETTGLDLEKSRICQIAAVKFRRGEVLYRASMLVDPGIPIEEEASAHNGITDEMVRGKPPLVEVAPRFISFLEGADILVGQNVYGFDVPILDRELGEGWQRLVAMRPILDTWPLVKHDDIGRYWRGSGRHKLPAICERLGIDCSDIPDVAGDGAPVKGSADCIRVVRVLWTLLQSRVFGVAAKRYLTKDAQEAERRLRIDFDRHDREFKAWLAKQPAREAEATPTTGPPLPSPNK